MLRKYSDVIELYTNITYQITRLSKQLGTNTKSSSATSANSTISSYNKIGDKIISLIAVVSSLSPNIPLDDYICDLMTMKLGDKLRRLRAGEISLYRDFFESSVPKFVSPVISSSVPISSTDIRYTQLDNFLQDVRQQLEFITIRRYLKLYTTVSVDKIASFVDMNSEQFLARLLALKSQNSQDDSLQFHIVDGDTIVIDHSGGSAGKGNGKTSSAEVKRYYMNGIRKNSDLWNETERLFKKLQF